MRAILITPKIGGEEKPMATHDNGLGTLAVALLEQGFSAVDEFGLSVTYQRADEPLKIHLDPDGSFTALDGNDEVIAEGNSVQALYEILVAKSVIAGRLNGPTRGPVWSRRRARRLLDDGQR